MHDSIKYKAINQYLIQKKSLKTHEFLKGCGVKSLRRRHCYKKHDKNRDEISPLKIPNKIFSDGTPNQIHDQKKAIDIVKPMVKKPTF
jgi:hypothetical protein